MSQQNDEVVASILESFSTLKLFIKEIDKLETRLTKCKNKKRENEDLVIEDIVNVIDKIHEHSTKIKEELDTHPAVKNKKKKRTRDSVKEDVFDEKCEKDNTANENKKDELDEIDGEEVDKENNDDINTTEKSSTCEATAKVQETRTNDEPNIEKKNQSDDERSEKSEHSDKQEKVKKGEKTKRDNLENHENNGNSDIKSCTKSSEEKEDIDVDEKNDSTSSNTIDPLRNSKSPTFNDNDIGDNQKAEESTDLPNKENQDVKPQIRLVDLNKLIDPKPKKSVKFDSSLIIISSDEEHSPKRQSKDKNGRLKSALKNSPLKLNESGYNINEKIKDEFKKAKRGHKEDSDVVISSSDSDVKAVSDGDEDDVRTRRSSRLQRNQSKVLKRQEDLKKIFKRKGNKNGNSSFEIVNDSSRKTKKSKDVLLKFSSESSNSNSDDEDIEEKTSRKNRRKGKQHSAPAPDDKCSQKLYVPLPLVECDKLKEVYLRNKEILEIKRLTSLKSLKKKRRPSLTESQDTDSNEESGKPTSKKSRISSKVEKKKKESSEEKDSSDDETLADAVKNSVDTAKEPDMDVEKVGEEVLAEIAMETLDQTGETQQDQECKDDSDSDVPLKKKGKKAIKENDKKKKRNTDEDKDVESAVDKEGKHQDGKEKKMYAGKKKKGKSKADAEDNSDSEICGKESTAIDDSEKDQIAQNEDGNVDEHNDSQDQTSGAKVSNDTNKNQKNNDEKNQVSDDERSAEDDIVDESWEEEVNLNKTNENVDGVSDSDENKTDKNKKNSDYSKETDGNGDTDEKGKEKHVKNRKKVVESSDEDHSAETTKGKTNKKGKKVDESDDEDGSDTKKKANSGNTKNDESDDDSDAKNKAKIGKNNKLDDSEGDGKKKRKTNKRGKDVSESDDEGDSDTEEKAKIGNKNKDNSDNGKKKKGKSNKNGKNVDESDNDDDSDTKEAAKTGKKKLDESSDESDSGKKKKGKINEKVKNVDESDDDDSDTKNRKNNKMDEEEESDSNKKKKGRKKGDDSSDSEDEDNTDKKNAKHKSGDSKKKIDSDEDNSDETKKEKKKWKKDKLLTEKLDSSDTEAERTTRSKKKNQKKNSDSDDDDEPVIRKPTRRTRKAKKVVVLSDSDESGKDKKDKDKNKDSSSEDSDQDSDSSDDNVKKKKQEEEPKKKKSKRIKRLQDSSEEEDDKSTRKNIRGIIDRSSLSESTIKAEEEEKKRKARIAEKQKKYNAILEDVQNSKVEKLLLEYDEKKQKDLLPVHKHFISKLKPHQANGVRFMWDACFESLDRCKKEGSGCILAHCMGLGKTLQVITLTHTLLTHSEKTGVSRVMVVCPINTVLNWKAEYKMWMPKNSNVEVYELVNCRLNSERQYYVKEWFEEGGVLIIGYTMFRMLSNPDNKKIPKKIRAVFHEGLVDPGPDLVVCDEGHLLKNEKTNLSIAMNRIRTKRRIVLTGTPLQNNLKEYWCMVQFIKPNLLGTYKEYLNRFVNPITNGQYTDSTQHDTIIMRKRSHVLHKLLDGVVQRRDYSVLEPYLPPKHEYVLFIKLSDVQIKLYKHYMERLARKGDGVSNRTSFLFTDFQNLQRICTHPRALQYKNYDRKEKETDEESIGSLKDFIDDDGATASSSSGSNSSDSDSDGSKSGSDKGKSNKNKYQQRTRVTRAQAAQRRENNEESDPELEEIRKEWWQEYCDGEELDNINNSGKLFLLFQILKECEEIGDKVLVFSQSLITLNVIEYFLEKVDEATQSGNTDKIGGLGGSWALGLDYFRLDGSSSCDNRAAWCNEFNNPDNTRARLFLISTKAGGLGINLVAANRVIIFDVSWNPSHDIQSIYRVYRFGQTKPCYIYRFVTYGAMEMKIYERQVTKQAISKRVIDEQQIDRHYNQNDLQELYKCEVEPEEERPIPLVPKDVLLGELLQKLENTIYKYHLHQSLLENKTDEGLNEEERKAAWEEFESEKVLRKTTSTWNAMGVSMGLPQLPMNAQTIAAALTNIVRKDNPTWSEIQIKGIIPALVRQLQVQMSENDMSMYTRVLQEIEIMQAALRNQMTEAMYQQQVMRAMQEQQRRNLLLGNPQRFAFPGNIINMSHLQNQLQRPAAPPSTSSAVIELND